jgi:hypothetical protein
MNAADPDAVWQLVQEALHGHAERLRLDADGRKNYGAHLADHRARLREERKLALAVEEMIGSIEPAALARFLVISQARPQPWAGGMELWPVADDRDGNERALLWSRAGFPYHRFSGGPEEKACRVCTGGRDNIQHQPFAGNQPGDGQAGRRAILAEMDKSRLAMLAHRKAGGLSLSAYRDWSKEDLIDAVLKAEYPG